jgi:hypothetical protein
MTGRGQDRGAREASRHGYGAYNRILNREVYVPYQLPDIVTNQRSDIFTDQFPDEDPRGPNSGTSRKLASKSRKKERKKTRILTRLELEARIFM